mgnify:CR=1 FL=1
MSYWFAAHIDRDFTTGTYGHGPTLYTNLIDNKDGIFNLKSYKEIDGGLEVTTECNNIVKLVGDYSISKSLKFMNDWEIWDKKYGSYEEDNRCDFKPILYTNFDDLKKDLTKN